jgi:hypothetical protein
LAFAKAKAGAKAQPKAPLKAVCYRGKNKSKSLRPYTLGSPNCRNLKNKIFAAQNCKKNTR